MGFVVPHVLAFALLASGLCVPGVVWDRFLLQSRVAPALRPVAFIVLSLATWMLTVFALCSVQLFTRLAVLVCLAVFAGAGVLSLVRHPPRWRPRMPGLGWIAVIPVLIGLAFFLELAAWPHTVTADASTYHLTIPKLYVAAHGFFRVPYNVYSHWPLGTELLFALGMMFHDYTTATLVHWGFGVATSIAIVAALDRQNGVGWVAAALFLANAAVMRDMVVAYVDLAYCFYFVATFLFLYRAKLNPDDRNLHLFLAGVGAGMAASTKVNGILGVVALSVLYPWRDALGSEQRPPLRPWVTRFGITAFCIAVIWPIKSWAFTGNPVYPFLWSQFGGPDWDNNLTEQFVHWQQSFGQGRGLRDYLLLPVRVILGGGPSYPEFGGIISATWIAIIPATIIFGWRQRLVRSCLGIGGLYFVLWALSSQQVRFLFPTIALLAIAAGATLASRLPSLPAAAHFGISTSIVALFWLSLTSTMEERRSSRGETQVTRFVHDQLHEHSLILFLNGNGGFYIDRPYIADSFFDASQIVEWLHDAVTIEAVHSKLLAGGVTHVLFGEQDWHVPYPEPLLAMLREDRGVRLLVNDTSSHQMLFSVCSTMACDTEAAQ